jgi:hypothetical protein
MDANIQEAIQSQVHGVASASQEQLLNSLTTLLDTDYLRLPGINEIRKRQYNISPLYILFETRENTNILTLLYIL